MNNLDIDFEVHKIRELNILHPTIARALETVKTAYESVKQQRSMNHGNIPGHYKPSCGLISGPSGVGKTTFLNFVKTALPPREVTKDGFRKTIIPCVYVSIANMSTPKSVTGRILEEFGQVVPSSATEHQMLRQLKTLFASCETNLVLLDEIHDIVPGTGVKKVMSWLKSLVNETKASIFLAGTEESEHIINANPELKTRFKMRMKLHNMHFQIDKSSEFQRYIQKLLSDIETRLVFKSVFTPSHHELSQLYLATDGNLENISTLMIEAARIALKNNHEELNITHIRDGFDKPGLYLFTRYESPESPFSLSEKNARKFVRMLGGQ